MSLTPEERIADPALAFTVALAEIDARNKLAGSANSLSPTQIFALGFAAGASVTRAELRAAGNAADAQVLSRPEWSALPERPTVMNIGGVAVASFEDMHHFARDVLHYRGSKIHVVGRTWRTLISQVGRSRDSEGMRGNERLIYQQTEFFRDKEALQAGLDPAVYLNLDKQYVMVNKLLEQYENVRSQFGTGIYNFGIGGIVFLARYMNHYLRPEYVLHIPDRL